MDTVKCYCRKVIKKRSVEGKEGGEGLPESEVFGGKGWIWQQTAKIKMGLEEEFSKGLGFCQKIFVYRSYFPWNHVSSISTLLSSNLSPAFVNLFFFIGLPQTNCKNSQKCIWPCRFSLIWFKKPWRFLIKTLLVLNITIFLINWHTLRWAAKFPF